MNNMSTREQVSVVLLVYPLGCILSGLVIRYGWNNFLTTLYVVPSINLAQAIGIDILFSYIITSSGRNENDYDYGEILKKAFVTPIFTFILLWIVTLFL